MIERLTVHVPEHLVREKDISYVHVLTPKHLPAFAMQYKLDHTFQPVLGIRPRESDILGYGNGIMDQALSAGANVAVVGDYTLEFYRAEEKRHEGIICPGVGVGVIIEDKRHPGKIVLTKRSGTSSNLHGTYDLPGGRAEIKDMQEAEKAGLDIILYTAMKEVEEETGLKVKPVAILPPHQHEPDGQLWINFGVIAEYVSGELRNGEPHKFEEIARYGIPNLPSPLSQSTQHLIEHYLFNRQIHLPIIRESGK